ncbi:carbohydrate kinase family protein [Caulobacter segnis]
MTCDLISPQATALDELKRLLPFVDYFMPSAAEAQFLTGEDDLFVAADVFRDLGAGGCIIKNGGRGSVVVLDGVRTTLPAYVIQPVDTTSCGDSTAQASSPPWIGDGRRWTPPASPPPQRR